jgi:hypothetical protein
MAPTSCFNGQVNRLPDAPEAYGAMITRAKAAPGQSRYTDRDVYRMIVFDVHNEQMDAGVAAIIGAAVGSLGTALAAGISGYWSRSQTKLQLVAAEQQAERQARAAHFAQIREPRKLVYAKFVDEADALLRHVSKALKPLKSADFTYNDIRPYLTDEDAVARLDKQGHAVALEGPEDLYYLATSVVEAIQRARTAGLAWALARGGAPPSDAPDPEADMEAALGASRAELVRFRHHAMLVLRAESQTSEVEEMRVRARALIAELDDGSPP